MSGNSKDAKSADQQRQETLFWLSRPGILDDVAAARDELERNATSSEEQIRAAFEAGKRPTF